MIVVFEVINKLCKSKVIDSVQMKMSMNLPLPVANHFMYR